ncbi:hypothetical protein D3C84_585670 [compost metagenome]
MDIQVKKRKVSSAIILIGLGILLATAVFISTVIIDKVRASQKASEIRVHINDVGKEIERGALDSYLNKISKNVDLKYHIDRTEGKSKEKYAVFLNLDNALVCDKLVRMLISDKEKVVIDGEVFTTDMDIDKACQVPPVLVSVVRKF